MGELPRRTLFILLLLVIREPEKLPLLELSDVYISNWVFFQAGILLKSQELT